MKKVIYTHSKKLKQYRLSIFAIMLQLKPYPLGRYPEMERMNQNVWTFKTLVDIAKVSPKFMPTPILFVSVHLLHAGYYQTLTFYIF